MVLKNRKYIGEYQLWQNRSFPEEAACQSLTLELVRPGTAADGSSTAMRLPVPRQTEEYLLTTKLFCGHLWAAAGRRERQEQRNGEADTIYYKCGGAKRKQGCTLKSRQEALDRAHRGHLQPCTCVLHDDVINRIADALVALSGQGG